MLDVTSFKPEIDIAISRYARKVSASGREDLRQDLYVLLMESWSVIQTLLEQRGEPTARLYAIETCKKYLTSRGESPDVSLSDPGLKKEAVPEILKTPGARNAVAAAVSRLPELERVVIRGLFYDDQSEDDIAKHLGRTKKWVSKTRQDALKKIASQLTRK